MYFMVQRFRKMVHGNTQPTSTATFVQVRIVGIYSLLIWTNLWSIILIGTRRRYNGKVARTPRFEPSRTAATTPRDDHMEINKHPEKDVTNKFTPPCMPVFDNDCMLTEEDIEVTAFIRQSCPPAEVVDVGETVLQVHLLRPNVTRGFIFDEVIP